MTDIKNQAEQPTPEADSEKPKHHFTKVSVNKTRVKYFDIETNSVCEVVLTGKLTMGQCKAYVQMINDKNVVVVKEPVSETFNVDTVALLLLREPE